MSHPGFDWENKEIDLEREIEDLEKEKRILSDEVERLVNAGYEAEKKISDLEDDVEALEAKVELLQDEAKDRELALEKIEEMSDEINAIARRAK